MTRARRSSRARHPITSPECAACGAAEATLNPAVFELPLCAACKERRRQRGIDPVPSDRAQPVHEPIPDLTCDPWHFRPFAFRGEIDTDGHPVATQRPPPVHVRSQQAPPAKGSSKIPGAVRRADADRLADAVGRTLNARRRAVADLYEQGYRYDEIAQRLGLSVRQVERDLYERRRGMRAIVMRERGAFE